jgi:hypothetical protein
MSDLPKPASAAPAPWPTRAKLDWAAERLDKLFTEMRQMEAATRDLRRHPTAHDLERARKAARHYEKHSMQEVVSGRAGQCHPDSWYDDDGRVRQSELSKMLALLVGSFPTSNVPEPAVFTRFMLEDVAAVGTFGPSFPAMEGACRELRTTKTFMPAIAEVIEAVKKHEAMWDKRYQAFDYIEGVYAELIEAIADAEKKIAAKANAKPYPQTLIEHNPSPPMTPLASAPATDPAPVRREWWKD